MGVNNGIITYPVNFAEPYQCLGVAKYNGEYHEGYICSNLHGKTNKWSKRKPLEMNKPSDVTEAELIAANYGIKEPSGSSDPNVAVEQDYVYIPPTTFYRINDFIGYNHNAMPPCPKQKDVTVNTFWGTEATFVPNIVVDSDPYSIGVSDFSWLKNCYVALVFHITSGNTVYRYYRTTENTIGDKSLGEWQIKFSYNEPPFNDSRTVINDVYYVACTKRYIKGDSEPYLQTFYPLPYPIKEDAKFTVIIKRGSPLLFSTLGLCHTPTQLSSDDIREYESGNGKIYRLTNHGTLYYEVDVRNDSDAVVTLNISNFKLSANQSFALGHVGQPTGQMQPEIYKYTTEWVSIGSSFTLNPGAREPFRIGLSHFLSYYNGQEYQTGEGTLEQIVSNLTYNNIRMLTTPPVNMSV